MGLVYLVLFVAGFYPLALAWRANRRTTLRHALFWAALAWTAWGAAIVLGPREGWEAGRYVALSLTGAAGVAVLGARRPQAAAWHFVLMGLLAVMLWPLVEYHVLGRSAHILPILFTAVILVVGILNYVPTGFGPAAAIFGLLCGADFVFLLRKKDLGRVSDQALWLVYFGLLLVPWIALASINMFSSPKPQTPLDSCWLTFRNRFGWIWGQRVREQFNQAAANAGWPVYLYWSGLVETGAVTDEMREKMTTTLQALLKRFGPEEA